MDLRGKSLKPEGIGNKYVQEEKMWNSYRTYK